MWYARRLQSSPPIVLMDENTTELRAQIEAKVQELADPWHSQR
jgi:ABC-type bacteriocin/lantibiotic exporter with double-glycine peptidase domain